MRRLARQPKSTNLVRLVRNEPNKDLIKEIETILENAEAGRIQSMAYTTVADGSVETGWVDNRGVGYILLSGIAVLQKRFTEAMDDQDQEISHR